MTAPDFNVDDFAMLDCPLCGGCGLVHSDDYDLGVAAINADALPALPDGIHPCPTCGGEKCERCGLTGRGSFARVYADNAGQGRATIQLWFGAAGTMELVATSDHSLAHDRVDSILATLAEAPGVVIRDRRGR